MSLEFGLGFGQDQHVANVAEYAHLAEELGFSHVTVADINNLAHEVNVLMTIAATGTTRIHIGHGVTNPATYHPGAIANAAASLRELAGNRIFIGIGAGGPYGQLLAKGVRMRTLERAIGFMRDYSAGREGELDEGSWHSEWIRRSRWNGTHVPVWVAVAGPETCRIAGRCADAVLSIGMDPVLQAWRRDLIVAGAEEAGRPPGEIKLYVRTQCYIAASKAAAKRELEPYAATCAWELFQILRRRGPDVQDLRARIEARHPGLVEEFGTIYEHYDPYWTERIGGPQTEHVSQRTIDFFLANGSPEDICNQIDALGPVGIAGVSSVLFSIHQDLQMMRRIACEVMPQLA